MHDKPLLFSLDVDRRFAEAVAAELGLALAPYEERRFEDGELKLRPLDSVHGYDVYLLLSLYGEAGQSINDKLCRLLFFIATLRDCGAARVTLVSPYLGYARKDRRTKAHDPVTTRYVAQLLEAVGTARVATLDVHNPAAFQNAFRCPSVHLEARSALTAALLAHVAGQPLTVVSPDAGGMKRADRLREAIAVASGEAPAMAIMEKRRSEGRVSGELLAGDLDGRVAVIVDDLISSGSTLLRTVAACRRQGARAVYGVVTHGLFAPGAEALLGSPALDRLLITDSVPPRLQSHWQGRVQIVPVHALIAEAIGALHRGRPLPEALEL